MTSPAARRRSGRKRDQIRAAAQRLFLSGGFAGTSMDAITAGAGVSKQTVYAYYRSKEELLADVLQTLVARSTATWAGDSAAGRAATPDLDAGRTGPEQGPLSRAQVEAELAEFARTVIETLMRPDYLGMARVVVAEVGRNPRLGELFRESVAGPVLARAAELVARGTAGGAIRPVRPGEAARVLVGSLLTYVLLDGLLHPGEPRRPPPGEIDRLVALLLDGLLPR